MALFKELNKLKKERKVYEDMIPCNNMGKWSRSVAIKSYTKKIDEIENEIKKLKENEKTKKE